jgi:hypothetical protein
MIEPVVDNRKCASEQASAKGNRRSKPRMYGQPGILERGWGKEPSMRALAPGGNKKVLPPLQK